MTEQMLKYTQAKGFEDIAREPEWPDKMEFPEWLRLAGFDSSVVDYWGNLECGSGVAWYVDHKSGRWLVDVTLGVGGYTLTIIAPTLADMMALRVQLATAQAPDFYAEFRSLRETFNKLFHALHHHSYLTECDSCDPETMRDLRRRNAENAAKRAKEGKKP